MSTEFDRIITEEGGVDMYLLFIQREAGLRSMAIKLESRLVSGANPKTFQAMVEESEYKRLLIDAVQSRGFEPTRQYIVRKLSNHPERSKVLVRPFKRSGRSTGLEIAFQDEYIGTAVDGLYEYLTSCDIKFRSPDSNYHGRLVSVVQSSGTGKTRTVNQLMQTKVLGLYMNVRSWEDTNSYPKRDKLPADILTENLGCSSQDYASRCTSFFTAIFTVIRGELVHKQGTEPVSNDTIMSWSKDMCQMGSPRRRDFFAKVKERHEQMLGKLLKGRGCTEEKTYSPDNGNSAEASATGSGLPGTSFMIEAYQKLVGVAPEFFDEASHTPKFVIAFDEAHMLSTRAHILCQVIGSFTNYSRVASWVIFVSTAAEVADFSAPCDHSGSSLPASQDCEELFAPYSLLDWDQLATPLREIKLQEVAQLDNIVGFGRPLWKSLLASSLSSHSILKTAGQKLCFSLDFNAYNSAQVLAVLGQRFCLDIRFGHSRAVELQRKAVSHHLRYCLSTTEDRAWQTTLYPSEPILSCAAAHYLYWTEAGRGVCDNLVPSLRRLWTDIKDGAVDVSEKGELVSRLVYLLAKDIFVRTPGFPGSKKDEILDCRMVPVIGYLEFVFGPSAVTDDVKNVFSGWYIKFSHWITMSVEIKTKEPIGLKAWLMRHWARTCAVQCCHDQAAIDKLIPMYKEPADSEDPYDGRMSYILISDRVRTTSSTKDLENVSPDGAGIHDLHQPYIAILADLRLNGSEPRFALDVDKPAPSLRIYAPGVNAVTYPFLGTHGLQDAQESLQKMLYPPEETSGSGMKLLEDHAQYGDTTDTSNMKWEVGRGEQL